MSVAAGAADAAYTALPQAPDAAIAGHSTIPTALDVEEQDELGEEVPPPTVLDSRVRWILFMLGCAVLAPWNVMITALPYFISRLTPELGSTFTSYMSVTFNITNVYFLFRATVTAKQAVGPRRTRLALIWVTSLVGLLALSTAYSNPPPRVFFAFVLINGVTQSAAGGYLQTAVVGTAARFGADALQSVMAGQAAVGVLVSAVQLASTAGSLRIAPAPPPTPPDSVETAVLFMRTMSEVNMQSRDAEARAAGWFFGLSTVFLLSTIGAHWWLIRLPAYRAVMDEHTHERAPPSPIMESHHPHRDERHALMDAGMGGDEKARIKRVAKANIVLEFTVAFVFTVTLAVFPPITLAVRPMDPQTNPLLFAGTHFLLFNVGDLTGRLLCSYPRLLIWSEKRLLAFSLARVLFIPAFLACNVPGSGAPLFGSDLVFFFILLVFGITNGYGGTMVMIVAPSVEHNPRLRGRREDVDTAATVASFALVSGLCGGAFASFVVRGIMCKCNPFLS